MRRTTRISPSITVETAHNIRRTLSGHWSVLTHCANMISISVKVLYTIKIGPLVLGSFGIHVKYGGFYGHEIRWISWQLNLANAKSEKENNKSLSLRSFI